MPKTLNVAIQMDAIEHINIDADSTFALGLEAVTRGDRVLTNGGPRDLTHVFATYAFQVGILSGNIPRGAAVSLFMLPLLATAAFFILRGVTRRNKEIM